ncbi:diacylglycerol kinase family protein [Fodinicurvata sediminis]|uniref:diacylglycerol kinase family protein n=1 Tax=Fodinicurvata sediminis TaxID=1121832 RepID=UPI00058F1C4C|nr:diacylglycerol kinase family protein [Fodinicurvata sediminis]
MIPGLVSNPLSQQNKQGMDQLEAAVDAFPGLHYERLDHFEDLPAALDRLAAAGVELLLVNGGDGTVQAVMTEVLERRPWGETPPVFGLLHGGMTNMTAVDVGLRGKPHRGLARLRKRLADGNLDSALCRRYVLRLEGALNTPPQRGMFFGAAAIYQAIQLCRTEVHPLKIEADWAAGLTLARLLGGWVFGGKSREAIRGETITAAFDQGASETRRELLAIATTLDRLVVGSRPFWNQQGEPLRYTSICYPPKGLLRHSLKVLYGGNERRLPKDCYRSRGADSVELELEGPFTLDGQFHEPDPQRPLRVSAPDSLDFVKL